MIKISHLSKQDLSVFQGKKVLLYTTDKNPVMLYRVFKHLGISVIGCYMEQVPSRKKAINNRIRGVVHIDKARLLKLVKQKDDIIVQEIFSSEELNNNALADKIAELGFRNSNIPVTELMTVFGGLVLSDCFKIPLKYKCAQFRQKKDWDSCTTVEWTAFRMTHMIPEKTAPIIICSPPKTADFSINHTFETINAAMNIETGARKIDYINLWHNPHLINRTVCEENFGTLKILVGVREPISQNLSTVYQNVAGGYYASNCLQREWEVNSKSTKAELLEKYERLFCEHGNDMQAYWDNDVKLYMSVSSTAEGKMGAMGMIQFFVPMFQKYVLDILSYPFDQEKGYTIIKEGNTQIFIYQLEKLNHIIPAFSQWVGVPFDHLVKANVAEDKWVGESYKQAQKEIEISQKYFDRCFEEPYVKHFYSQADIEKFKARWRPNVKK